MAVSQIERITMAENFSGTSIVSLSDIVKLSRTFDERVSLKSLSGDNVLVCECYVT